MMVLQRCVNVGIVVNKGVDFGVKFAAQQIAEADHTSEDFSEVCFVIGAFQFAHRSTVSAVWRLS